MSEQLRLPLDGHVNDGASPFDKDDYVPVGVFTQFMRWTDSEEDTMSCLLGARLSPFDDSDKLFILETHWNQVWNSNIYQTLVEMGFFERPHCGPYLDEIVACQRLYEQLKRLMEYHKKGDRNGVVRTCNEINAGKQSGIQS